jgi:hypothetical protein
MITASFRLMSPVRGPVCEGDAWTGRCFLYFFDFFPYLFPFLVLFWIP